MSVRQDQVQVNVEINGAKAGESLKEIRGNVKQLNRELDLLTIGTEAWYKKLAEIKNAKKPLDEAREAIKGVDTAVKDTTASSGSFSKSLLKIGEFFAGGGLLSLAEKSISGIKSFFSDAIDEANEAELATSRFQSTLDNLGKADVFEKFIGLANDLANKLQYLDNDDITGVLEKLALYGKLTENQVKELLPVIIDFAAKQRISVGDAAESIIGALEGQGKALKQYGINIKDAKTETERLDIVLTTLKPKVEGAAEAFGNTLAGKTAIAEQNIKNLKEEIGTGLQPLIEKWYSFVAKVISDIGNIFSSEDLGFFGKLSALFGNQSALATANIEKARKLMDENKAAVAELKTADTGNELFGSTPGTPAVKTEEELRKEEELRRKQAELAARAKSKRDQDNADRKAAQEKLNQDIIQLEKDLAQSVIDAQKDGIEKEVALENFRFQNGQVNIKKRELALKAAGANREYIDSQINALIEANSDIHDNKLLAIQDKYDKEKQAKNKQTQGEDLREKEEYYKNEIDSVNLYYDTLINAIREREAEKLAVAGSEDEILAIKKNAADAQLALEIQKNEELKKISEENGKSTLEYDTFLRNARLEGWEKERAGKRAVEDAVKETIKDGLDFAIQALSRDEAARKKNAGLIKAFSVAKIAVNLAEEISGIFKNANNVYPPPYGNILGAVQAALAVGRSTIAIGNINRAQFAKGGHTGPGEGSRDNTGHKVAGVVHANEWVSPQWMTQHPVYGSVIHRLEDARVRGFADGGFTTTPTTGLPALPMGLNEDFLKRIAEAVERFPREIKAKMVYSDFESVENDVHDIRDSASIG